MRISSLFFLLVAAFTVVLAGCGLGATEEGSLVVTIASLPSGVSSITVSVSGDDMETVSQTYTGDPADGAPLVVPAGTGRRWTVIVQVDGAGPVTTYSANGTADIVAGEITNVDATLRITGTKLVILDDGNSRIVQIDDISGTGWTVFADTPENENWNFWGLIDLEIGPDGRIYFTDQEMQAIHVMDTIAGETVTTVPILDSLGGPDGNAAPEQIGIDHSSGTIFYSDNGTGLLSVPLAGGEPADYSADIAGHVTGIDPQTELPLPDGIKGVTVDDAGIVFILYRLGDDVAALSLDPAAGGTVLASRTIITDSSAANARGDIVAKNGRLYALIHAEGEVGPIVQLDAALNVVDSYGTLYDPEIPAAEMVYGPIQFVGHRNADIQFMDMSTQMDIYNRIAEISSFSVASPTGFGTTGSAEGQFMFEQLLVMD